MADYDLKKDLLDAVAANDQQLAGLDAGPEAAQGQSAELMGGASEEQKEKERIEKAQVKWETLLGEKIGGKLFDLLLQNASYEQLNTYVTQAITKLAETLKGGAIKKPIKGSVVLDEQSEVDALNAFVAALGPAIEEQVLEWMNSDGAQNFLQGVAEWTQEHPMAVLAIAGGAAIGAAVAAYLSDYDPGEFAKTFNLGKGWSVGGAVDVASLQKILSQGVDSARLFVEYKGEKLTSSMGVGYEHGKGVNAKGELNYKGDNLSAGVKGSYDGEKGHDVSASADWEKGGTKASVKGSHTAQDGYDVSAGVERKGKTFFGSLFGRSSEKDGNSATATLGYETEKHKGKAQLTHNEKGTTAQIGASGEGQLTDDLKGSYDSNVTLGPDGTATVKLGGDVTGKLGKTDVSAGVGLTHSSGEGGGTEIEADIKLGPEGKETKVKGTIDPSTGAFTFKLDQAFGSGVDFTTGIGKDKDGNLSHNQGLTVKRDKFEFSATNTDAGGIAQQALNLKLNPTGALTKFSMGMAAKDGKAEKFDLGAAFDIGRFSNELDISMGEATTIGASTKGQAGNFQLGASTKLNLTDKRLDELRVSLGWEDPEAFRSFYVGYGTKWVAENAAYAHEFDARFEYSVDRFALRWNAQAQMQGGGLTQAGTDLTMGYKVNENWDILAQGRGGMQMNNGARQETYGVGVGAQYKGIPIMLNVDQTRGGKPTVSLGVTIPLNFGSKRR